MESGNNQLQVTWGQPHRAFCSAGGMPSGSWRAAGQEQAAAKEPGQWQSKYLALQSLPCPSLSYVKPCTTQRQARELHLVHDAAAIAGMRGKKPNSSSCWVRRCKPGRECTVSLAPKEQSVLERAKATVSLTIWTNTAKRRQDLYAMFRCKVVGKVKIHPRW